MHLGIHPQHPPLAPGHGFAASSVSYGVAVPGACPIVGSFGGKNRNLRGAAQKLDRALEALGVDHDVKEYPDAGAYLPQRPPRGGRLERPVHGDRTSPCNGWVHRRLPRTLSPRCPPTHPVVLRPPSKIGDLTPLPPDAPQKTPILAAMNPVPPTHYNF